MKKVIIRTLVAIIIGMTLGYFIPFPYCPLALIGIMVFSVGMGGVSGMVLHFFDYSRVKNPFYIKEIKRVKAMGRDTIISQCIITMVCWSMAMQDVSYTAAILTMMSLLYGLNHIKTAFDLVKLQNDINASK